MTWDRVLGEARAELGRRTPDLNIGELLESLGVPADEVDGVIAGAVQHIDSVAVVEDEGPLGTRELVAAMWFDGFSLGVIAARIQAGAPE